MAMKQEKDELKRRIKDSGLRNGFIAKKLNLSDAHFSMMLSGAATMPEEIRNKTNEIIRQAMRITV